MEILCSANVGGIPERSSRVNSKVFYLHNKYSMESQSTDVTFCSFIYIASYFSHTNFHLKFYLLSRM